MTTQKHDDLFAWDHADEALANCSAIEPPAELHGQVLQTIPEVKRRQTSPTRPLLQRLHGSRRRLRFAVAACAATLAFVLFFLSRTETPAAAEPWDLLVAASEASRKVEALHVTTFIKYDDESFWESKGMSEQWWLRHVGYATLSRDRHGNIRVASVLRPTVQHRYSSITNEYVVEPVVRSSQLAWDFTPPPQIFDVNDEQNFIARTIKAATEQDLQIDVVERTIKGRRVRQMRADEVDLAGEKALQHLYYSVEVEIDVATNHIIRTRTREREVIKPGREEYFEDDYVPTNSVTEQRYEYPSPSEFDLSVFKINVPESAVVRNLESPSWLLKDRDKLLVIGVFIQQYLINSDPDTEGFGRYPDDFVAALTEMENFPERYLYNWTWRGMDRSKPVWTFFHAGEKADDIRQEGELWSTTQMHTVIAEKRYDSGHVLQLFADGNVRITPPEQSAEVDTDR